MTPVTKQEENNKRLYSTKRKEKKDRAYDSWLVIVLTGYTWKKNTNCKNRQRAHGDFRSELFQHVDVNLSHMFSQTGQHLVPRLCYQRVSQPSCLFFFYHSQPSDCFLRSPQLKMYLFGTNPPKARGKNRRVSNTHFQKKFLHFSNSSWSIRHCSSQLLSELTCLGAAQRRSASQNRTNSLSSPPLLGELLWWRKLTPTAFLSLVI